jgi:thiamine biosynthesis lipoprotein
MGTVFEIQLYSADEHRARAALAEAFAVIRAHDQRLSDWRSDSELNQVLRAARASTDPVPLSEALHADLQLALDYARLSGGALDPTIGPLVRFWGFRPRAGALRLSDWLQARRAVGYQKLQLLADPPRLRLRAEGMQLDFGALGKGLALDRAAEVLRRQGVVSAALRTDSSMLFMGSPPRASVAQPPGWPVLVRHPRQPERPVARLWLQDQALATSGDDQQFRQILGLRYSHLIDPRSGFPARYNGSLTVIAPAATAADAWSTALLLQPPARLPALLQAKDLQAVRVWHDRQGWRCQVLGLPAPAAPPVAECLMP